MTRIDEDGRQSFAELMYIRGSQIRFIMLPDMLRHAPFFNRIKYFREFKGHAVYGAAAIGKQSKGGGTGTGQNPPMGRGDDFRSRGNDSARGGYGPGPGRGGVGNPRGPAPSYGGGYGGQGGGGYGGQGGPPGVGYGRKW